MNKIKEYWRPMAAIVYFVICIFDFIIMPLAITTFSKERDFTAIYTQVNLLSNPQAQVALINKIHYDVQTWKPLTLISGGMFHLAFGGLLTGAAITRGLENKARVERGA